MTLESVEHPNIMHFPLSELSNTSGKLLNDELVVSKSISEFNFCPRILYDTESKGSRFILYIMIISRQI